MKSAMTARSSPFPFPCLRTFVHNKGPGRNKFSGKFIFLPNSLEDFTNSITQFRCAMFTTSCSRRSARPGTV
jgi:hypothetical protein